MTATVRVAPGTGWLARRPAGLLYTAGEWPESLGSFVEAVDDAAALDSVTAAAVAAGFEAPPFVAVTWSDRVQCVVFGDVALRTEDPSAPMLSAAGSSTWIERRLALADAPLRVWCGADALAGSCLDAGIVPSGGFELVVDAVTEVPQPEPSSVTSERATFGPPAAAPPDAAPPDVAPEPTLDAAEAKARGIEALTAATGGDWMEDSLGLRPAGGSPAPAAVHDTERSTSGDGGGGERAPGSDTTGPGPRLAVPPGLDDDESTWIPTIPSSPPPQAGTLPPPSPVEASGQRQGLVAVAVLPDGSTAPIAGTVVFGRNPNRAAARVGDDAALVVTAAPNSVSRTHVSIEARGATLTATDCGSRGGVVLVTPGREPLMLEPWVPQEVSIGDTLYLGGPNGLLIEPARETGAAG